MKTRIIAAILLAFLSLGTISSANAASWRHHRDRDHRGHREHRHTRDHRM